VSIEVKFRPEGPEVSSHARKRVDQRISKARSEGPAVTTRLLPALRTSTMFLLDPRADARCY